MDSVFEFEIDQPVRITRIIRNDGTHPQGDRGSILAYPEQKGVVIGRGFFLQDIVVYSIRLESGITVGCMAKELAPFEERNPVEKK